MGYKRFLIYISGLQNCIIMPAEVEHLSVPTRPCKVEVKKLTEAKGDYKKSDIVHTVKLTKDEKSLLLPKKSANSKNKEVKTPKKRGRIKNYEFKMKISGFSLK